MTGRRSTWWKWFALGAALVIVALAWVTSAVLDLERSEWAARADARRQEVLRLALWRMDSWLAPRLARESARPYFEYLSYFPQERAYTRMLTPIEEGAILTPSPLLTFREPFITLHFQIDESGRLSSPQVPTSNHRDLAESTVLSAATIVGCNMVLERVEALIDVEAIRAQVARAEQRLAMTPLPLPPQQQVRRQQEMSGDYQKAQTAWTMIEQTKRMARNAEQLDAPQQQMLIPDESGQQVDFPAQGADIAAIRPDAVQVGPFVPLWVLGGGEQAELVYLRQIRIGKSHRLQGFLVDWSRLRETLIEEVSDLMPGADLVPRLDEAEGNGSAASINLATVPACVRGLPPLIASIRGMTPTRLALLIVWGVVVVALGAGGMMLHASLLYGRRRSDFASAVTHELRTPLTTFRLYSEMLADDMIPEPARRREYLETLRTESSRLARLVENVLAYARLEEGRQHTAPRRVAVRDLIDDVRPALERQAADHGMFLRIDNPLDSGECVCVDRDSVGRILTNLVDNACKYAGAAADRSIDLGLSRVGGHVHVAVRDHGPGVAPDAARTLFAPFRRGRSASREAASGVGLGLALCRALARDMGGDLRLAALPPGQSGACFIFELPVDARGCDRA